MQAVVGRRYGNPKALRLEDVPEPQAEAGTVLVRVRAASVNAGDWRLTRGLPLIARPMMGGLRGPSPAVRGWDFAGVVESVGAGVEELAVGEEVFGNGVSTFAQLVSAKADRVAPKPGSLTFEEAAAIPVAGVSALQSLRRAEIEPGRRVLVNGAGGGVGTFSVQIAKWLGADVTAVCSGRNAELARSLGADRVIDYAVEDFTRERGAYDVVVDNVGNRSLRAMRRALAKDGTLVVLGGGHGRILGPLGGLGAVLLLNRFVSQRLIPFLAKPTRADLEELAGLVEAGTIRVVVDRTYPLQDTPAAVAYVEEGHARGKVVVTVS